MQRQSPQNRTLAENGQRFDDRCLSSPSMIIEVSIDKLLFEEFILEYFIENI